MHTLGEARLLRIFVGEKDRAKGQPLYEYVVRRARESGLAGATVLRGIEGFGASSLLHTARLLRLSDDLPILIEIADKEERIQQFVDELDDIFDAAGCGGLVTTEKVQVLVYRPG
jgi:PII-like signaling protein